MSPWVLVSGDEHFIHFIDLIYQLIKKVNDSQ